MTRLQQLISLPNHSAALYTSTGRKIDDETDLVLLRHFQHEQEKRLPALRTGFNLCPAE